MIVRSFQTSAIAPALREYLRTRLGLRDLDYVSALSQITDGWEAYTYRFQLGSKSELSKEYRQPLILHLYSCPNGLPALHREHKVQSHLFRRGFPVARPILLEEDSDIFGGPFMIMEQLPGLTLVEAMFRSIRKIFTVPFQMGALHARLHALPVEDFPAPARPFLARKLDELSERIQMFDLDGLKAGWQWLVEHRPPDPETPSILHLDFHPINLLYHKGRIRGVLDWPEADVGDSHADVATTLLLMNTCSVELLSWLRRFWSLPGRKMLPLFYQWAYTWKRPFDEKRLSYYGALAALRRLSRWGMWLRESPKINGCKPGAIGLVSPESVARLEGYFSNQSGISVRLMDCL